MFCQGEAVAGAQVTVSGPSPLGGQVWSGVTGGDGGFSTDLIFDAGSYIVEVLSPGASYDSLLVTVPADGYGSVLAQCTVVYGRGH